jgi:TonB family protein
MRPARRRPAVIAIGAIAALVTVVVLVAPKPEAPPSPLAVAPPPGPRQPPARIPIPPPPPPPPSTFGGNDEVAPPRLYAETSFRALGGGSAPVRIRDVRPVYPPIAVSYDLRGQVELEARIDEQGRISDARVVRSMPILDQATIDAVRRWEFEPTYKQGSATPVVITVTATFDRPAPRARRAP